VRRGRGRWQRFGGLGGPPAAVAVAAVVVVVPPPVASWPPPPRTRTCTGCSRSGTCTDTCLRSPAQSWRAPAGRGASRSG